MDCGCSRQTRPQTRLRRSPVGRVREVVRMDVELHAAHREVEHVTIPPDQLVGVSVRLFAAEFSIEVGEQGRLAANSAQPDLHELIEHPLQLGERLAVVQRLRHRQYTTE